MTITRRQGSGRHNIRAGRAKRGCRAGPPCAGPGGLVLNHIRRALDPKIRLKLCNGLAVEVVPRAGIEPATRGFSRLVLKIMHCFYCIICSVLLVCEKLCYAPALNNAGKHCGQHSLSNTVHEHSLCGYCCQTKLCISLHHLTSEPVGRMLAAVCFDPLMRGGCHERRRTRRRSSAHDLRVCSKSVAAPHS
jgi:hypothetical protein